MRSKKLIPGLGIVAALAIVAVITSVGMPGSDDAMTSMDDPMTAYMMPPVADGMYYYDIAMEPPPPTTDPQYSHEWYEPYYYDYYNYYDPMTAPGYYEPLTAMTYYDPMTDYAYSDPGSATDSYYQSMMATSVHDPGAATDYYESMAAATGYCGDYTLNMAEQCDDGSTVAGDGCSETCALEYCGDGVVQAGLGETCDPGHTMGTDACTSWCTEVARPADEPAMAMPTPDMNDPAMADTTDPMMAFMEPGMTEEAKAFLEPRIEVALGHAMGEYMDHGSSFFQWHEIPLCDLFPCEGEPEPRGLGHYIQDPSAYFWPGSTPVPLLPSEIAPRNIDQLVANCWSEASNTPNYGRVRSAVGIAGRGEAYVQPFTRLNDSIYSQNSELHQFDRGLVAYTNVNDVCSYQSHMVFFELSDVRTEAMSRSELGEWSPTRAFEERALEVVGLNDPREARRRPSLIYLDSNYQQRTFDPEEHHQGGWYNY